MANLITLADYKSYKNLKQTDNDVKLTLLITAVSNLIQTYIGRSFDPNSANDPITETFAFDYETSAIFPSQYPVSTLTSVTVNGMTDYYPYDSTIHWENLEINSDYSLIGDTIYLNNGSWPQIPASVEIVYYVTPATVDGTIPAELQLAAIELVSYYANEGWQQSRTIMGSSVTNTVTQDPNFPPYIRAIMDSFRG